MNHLIIQARMGSSRLPGKTLRPIQGKPMVQWMLERVQPSKRLNQITVATSDLAQDDAIEALCQRLGVSVFRGSESDVLDRYHGAATAFGGPGDTIIRATADCPLHHHSVIDFAIDAHAAEGWTYFSNSNHPPDVLEDGIDTEVFTYDALDAAWKEAKRSSEREHVTLFIKAHAPDRCGYRKFLPNYEGKLSVDNANDFKLVSTIFEMLQADPLFSVDMILDLLKMHPELAELNQSSIINEGLANSLAKESAHKKES